MKYTVYVMLGFLTVMLGCAGELVSPFLNAECYPTSVSPNLDFDQMTIEYDSSFRVVRLATPPVTQVIFTYDANGNLLLDGSSTCSYDSVNRTLTISAPNASNPDEGLWWTYAYNAKGQIASITYKEKSSSYNFVQTIYYNYPNDITNNFSSVTNSLSDQVEYFEYDDRPNPIRKLGLAGRYLTPIDNAIMLYFTDNNITKIRSVSSHGESQTVLGYKYTKQGYPEEVLMGTGVYRKYTYKCR